MVNSDLGLKSIWVEITIYWWSFSLFSLLDRCRIDPKEISSKTSKESLKKVKKKVECDCLLRSLFMILVIEFEWSRGNRQGFVSSWTSTHTTATFTGIWNISFEEFGARNKKIKRDCEMFDRSLRAFPS